ncbi:MAG: metal dependent phosphohydrolase [Deltaproteobacteria bacterium]|nr:metal dependent phosphohydrolase [Deltaproteobacteria bacterium]
MIELPEKPLYNSRIIDTYIKLIKRKYSYINVSELLDYAGMEPYQVADQGHWFTQSQVNRFHEKLAKLTGNEEIAREAGRYAASPDAIGVMRQYILGLIGPSKAYERLEKASAEFTRSSTLKAKKLASNKIEFIVTPGKGVKEEPFQCENRTGFYEAAATIFNAQLPKIEHPECIFKGGRVCRYIISWKESSAAKLRTLRNYTALVFVVIFIALSLYDKHFLVPALLTLFLILLLTLQFLAHRSEKQELEATLDSLKDATDNLLEQINLNYNNALITNEIGQAISKQTHIEDILTNVVQVLDKRLDYERGLILLANPKRTRLIFRAGFGYNEDQLRLLGKTMFHLDRPDSTGIFIVSFREQRPFLINDIHEIEGTLSPRSLEFAKWIGVKSFICCPIICDGISIGILAVDNIKSKRPLLQSDMSLIMGIAPVIGISIHNANLIEAKVKQFTSVLKVMASTIDARDPLTAGHSEKVTEYAVGICEELGLSEELCEVIRVAALLHDYGKVGVPDSILKKNGRLSEIEYELVKTHASKTKEILLKVHFEGIYQPVPYIAGAHHENVDGSGYPAGLTGTEMPLGAKIIGVADFFEAITAKRHYRNPMTDEEAVRLLRENTSTKFDKSIVEAFIRYYSKMSGYTELPRTSSS